MNFETNRWQKLAGLKESCEEPLDESGLELAAAGAGLLFSGVLTGLIYTQGLKALSIFKDANSKVENLVSSFQKNVAQKEYDKQKAVYEILKKVTQRFLHDDQMISFFEELKPYMNQSDEYSIGKKNEIVAKIENYISSKLSPVEKKHLKQIIKFITNDF